MERRNLVDLPFGKHPPEIVNDIWLQGSGGS